MVIVKETDTSVLLNQLYERKPRMMSTHSSLFAPLDVETSVAALKTISNYTDHISPNELDHAFRSES